MNILSKRIMAVALVATLGASNARADFLGAYVRPCIVAVGDAASNVGNSLATMRTDFMKLDVMEKASLGFFVVFFSALVVSTIRNAGKDAAQGACCGHDHGTFAHNQQHGHSHSSHSHGNCDHSHGSDSHSHSSSSTKDDAQTTHSHAKHHDHDHSGCNHSHDNVTQVKAEKNESKPARESRERSYGDSFHDAFVKTMDPNW